MDNEERPAYDLLREWIANDTPVYHFGLEVVTYNRDNGLNAGNGLRDLVLDIRSVPSAYRSFCEDLGRTPLYKKHGYPVEDGPAKWTMRRITDRDFGAVDWSALADDVFPIDN